MGFSEKNDIDISQPAAAEMEQILKVLSFDEKQKLAQIWWKLRSFDGKFRSEIESMATQNAYQVLGWANLLKANNCSIRICNADAFDALAVK